MIKRKKIAIFSRALWTNGATKSLVELLRRLDYEYYNVDLIVLDFSKQAKWIKNIPKEVNIIPVERWNMSVSSIKKIIRNPIFFIKSLYSGYELKKNTSLIRSMKYTAMRLPMLSKKYDIAISYRHFDLDVFFVANNISADKKYFFVHGVQSLNNEEVNLLSSSYKKYDGCFTVSETAKKNMLKYFKNVITDIKVAYCVVDEEEILELFEQGNKVYKKDKNTTIILTVSRLGKEKGIDIALETCFLLKLKGYNIKWYIIGDGPEKVDLLSKIKKYNIEDEFIFLGEMENPYGFIGTCDIYVQPSRLESYGLTVNEAKIFNRPIVCSDIPAFNEQIVDGVTGVISELSADNFCYSITKLIDNKNIMAKLSSNLEKENKSHFEVVDIFNGYLKII